MDIKIVIGAQYGDEGKGRTVDLFTKECKNGNMAVVLTNGGAQRGHTASNGVITHIFHHFGSGTLNGADTIISKDFKVNPIIFRKEWNELGILNIHPTVYVDSRCAINMPWDAIINQCWEYSLGDSRFGSCGIGIYESIVRSENSKYSITVSDILDAYNKNDWAEIENVLDAICIEWVPNRLKEVMDGKVIPDIFANILEKDIVPAFIDDLRFFVEHITVVKRFSSENLKNKYIRIIFENAQGLAISQEYYRYGENTTPTITGIKSALDSMESMNLSCEDNIEICYVTRWYTTRHGAGILPGETSLSNISPNIIDNTNIYNEWQGSIRYALLDVEKVSYRIMRDINNIGAKNSNNINISVAINCIDQNISDNVRFTMNGLDICAPITDMCSLIFDGIRPFLRVASKNSSHACYLGYSADSDKTVTLYF